MARPTGYNTEIAAKICDRMRELGGNLSAVCRADDMPERHTVMRWVEQFSEFSTSYARARQAGYELMADDIADIADTPAPGVIETDKLDKDGCPYTEIRRADMIEHRRLRVDTRKWLLAKVLPKIYGDKLAVEHSGTLTLAERIRAARGRVATPTDGNDLV